MTNVSRRRAPFNHYDLPLFAWGALVAPPALHDPMHRMVARRCRISPARVRLVLELADIKGGRI